MICPIPSSDAVKELVEALKLALSWMPENDWNREDRKRISAALAKHGTQAATPSRPTIEQERAAAEQQYTVSAFDYVSNPVGSRDWTLYWAGWLARSTAKSEGEEK